MSVAAPTAPSGACGKLIMSPSEAATRVLAQLERGQAVRKLRIRSTEDLDKARLRKGEWVVQTHDLLAAMFDTDDVAGDFNLCEHRVLPDYAEAHEFAQGFVDEMEQRLAKLRTIHRRIPPGGPPAAAVVAEPKPPAKAAVPESRVEPPPVAPIGEPRCLLVAADDSPATAAVEAFLTALGFAPERVDGSSGLEGDAAFAVCIVGEPSYRLAFDLGHCAGRCGAGRVFVVAHGDASWLSEFELPSIALDATDLWQLQLARQLKRSGVSVDLNRLC